MDLDELPLQDLLELVQENPGLLRRPIMIDEKRLQVGFNEDEIRRFLPRDVRQLELRQAQLMAVYKNIKFCSLFVNFNKERFI